MNLYFVSSRTATLVNPKAVVVVIVVCCTVTLDFELSLKFDARRKRKFSIGLD